VSWLDVLFLEDVLVAFLIESRLKRSVPRACLSSLAMTRTARSRWHAAIAARSSGRSFLRPLSTSVNSCSLGNGTMWSFDGGPTGSPWRGHIVAAWAIAGTLFLLLVLA
jgi:hypothetical protein